MDEVPTAWTERGRSGVRSVSRALVGASGSRSTANSVENFSGTAWRWPMPFGCVPVVGMGLMWPKGRNLTLNRSYHNPWVFYCETEVVLGNTGEGRGSNYSSKE